MKGCLRNDRRQQQRPPISVKPNGESPKARHPAVHTSCRKVSIMAKRRTILSGWCENQRHQKCAHQMQTANDKRPGLWCQCPCHPASNHD